MIRRQLNAPSLPARAAAQARSAGIELARLQVAGEVLPVFLRRADQVDGAGHGIAAPKRAQRAAHNLDAAQPAGKHVRKVQFAAQSRVADFHSIHEHQGMIGFCAAQPNLGKGAEHAAAAYGHSGCGPQKLVHGLGLTPL